MLSEQDRIERLAEKKVWLAALLSFIIPLAGYSYTGRWKPFGIFLLIAGVCGGISSLVPKNQENATARTYISVLVIGGSAAIDNVLGVKRAKKRASLKLSQFDQASSIEK